MVDLPIEGELPSLDGATAWLNSAPLTAADLRGHVLVQFWTFTCINWLRTLPYVRAWAEKDMQIEYPLAVDSDYTIWDAFANRYWPALYFADAERAIRDHHFGEGR